MSQNYGSMDKMDPQKNLTSLTQRIKANLLSIRQITQTLNDLYTILGGIHDCSSKQDDIHKQQVKANQLLALTKSLFESTSQIGVLNQDQRMQISRVKEEYEGVIRKYGEIQQKIMNKLNQIVIEKREAMSSNLVDVEEMSQSRVQLVENEEELRLAEETGKRMEQLEKDLINVQKMFSDINELVIEDRQGIEHIDSNVETAYTNVDEANVQLDAATIYKRKALKKKIILILVILVLLTVIGLIIGFSVKKK